MSKTYKKTDDNWEQKRRKEDKKREKYEKKREFLNPTKVHREDDEDGQTGRRR